MADGVAGHGPWLTSKEAAAYVGNKSVRAFYTWRRDHGIVQRANHTVAKADLDRVLNRRVPPRRMAAASLRNLPNLRHASASR